MMIDKVESPLYSEIGFKVLAPGLLPAQENNGDILLNPRNTLKKFTGKLQGASKKIPFVKMGRGKYYC